MPDAALPKINISRLPEVGAHFTGRENEIKLLNKSWENPDTHIVSLVAPGGVGKTTIVAEWLQLLQARGYSGAQRIFAWSFYSQGTSDQQQSSSDLFMQDALRFFGVDTIPEAPHERGVVLAQAIRQSRSLLLLDGLEPLQYPPGPVGGELKDPALKALLKELAFDNPGLCIITTRIAVKEIEGRSTTICYDLQNLDVPTGMAFLKELGVKGSQEDMEAAVAEFKGHALALRLLGNYLSEFMDGDIRRRDRILHLTDDEREGGHAKQVMEAYVAWFGADAPEIALLHVLSLFDRPCPAEALDALLADPPIVGLTDALQKLSLEKWRLTLNHLVKLGLIGENRLPDTALDKSLPHLPALRRTDNLDAHPLLREYFGERHQTQNPGAWCEAHTRLYQYYKNLPEKKLPDTLDEMEPLFYAIAHGCKAGKQQEALEEVYWNRISRTDKFYTTDRLGAFGSDLSALAHFFEHLWDQPSRNLTESEQADVLGWAGFRLQALGRLPEATEPMRSSLAKYVEQNQMKEAASSASNIGELYLTSGNIAEAVKYGQLSVQYADQSGDEFFKVTSRTTHAYALCQSGDLETAIRLFEEAEAIQQISQPGYHLYSLQGYEYCDILFGLEKYGEISERALEGLEISEEEKLLLDTALNKLTLGRVLLVRQQAENNYSPQTGIWLNEAVEGLRNAGSLDHLPRGLLVRATWHRYEGRYTEAYQDLREVLEIAESRGMRLYLVDYHIEMAKLLQDRPLVSTPSPTPPPNGKGDVERDAAWHKAEARRLIEQTGYKRRLAEVEAL
ncbi:MAG: hypothetical protein DYG98_12270 [Haliscomenobacteraceae bacterium CHB4]|nr:hypothetical protein [Saprospiraceae bacterium]MCE7923825.1 hypothetical protein [Haliscomenobacteraceae bacterium CHB4]